MSATATRPAISRGCHAWSLARCPFWHSRVYRLRKGATIITCGRSGAVPLGRLAGGGDSIFAEVHARQQAILKCRSKVYIGRFLDYSDRVKFAAPKAFVAKFQIKSIHVFIFSIS